MPSPTISTSPGSASRTAPPRHGPSIIFCGSTGALPPPSRARKVRWIASGVAVRAVRHQRHHRRPDAARGMLQAGMEAQRVGRRQIDAARRRDRFAPAFLRRPARAPDRQRGLAALAGIGVGVSVFFVGDAIFALVSPAKAAFAQDGDVNVALIAAGMAVHQHLAVFARADRKARRSGRHAGGIARSSRYRSGARQGPWRWSPQPSSSQPPPVRARPMCAWRRPSSCRISGRPSSALRAAPLRSRAARPARPARATSPSIRARRASAAAGRCLRASRRASTAWCGARQSP